METITFHCKVITPMFLAGADGKTPELRAPSIKGAMRFWWRACNGHLPLEEMKKREQELFGGVGNGGAQRSKVILQVKNQNLVINSDILPQNPEYKQSVPGTNKSSNVLEYLAYGVVTKPGKIERSYFSERGEFDINIRLPEEMKEEIIDIVGLISYFGGIGSRSRNGYGSFSTSGLNKTAEDLFRKNKNGGLKNYTAFSENSRLFLGSSSHERWEDALFEVGNEYRKGRLMLEGRHSGEKRKFISQPLMIKDSNAGKYKILIPGNSKPLERNAKSFFLGVTQTETGFQGHILYLPHTLTGHPRYLSINDELANFFSSSTGINEVK